MKQKSKNIIIHASSHLVLFLGVVFGVSTLNEPTPSPASPVEPETSATVQNNKDSVSNNHVTRVSGEEKRVPKITSSNPNTPDKIKQSISKEYLYRIFEAPNDPEYSSSDWAFAQINAETAWDITTGDGSTVVAVIDSGYALDHDDLSGQWYENTGETGNTQLGDPCWTGSPEAKASNSCDDDANGYIDDWRGWNFVLGDNNPQTGREDASGDGVRHGTQVSGLIGATSDNGIGITALNWNTKLMPLQALDDDGVGYTSDVAASIYYAVDNGANVINLSLGSYSDDPAVETAVDYASANDVVVVAAAGNCGNGGGSDCAGVPIGQIGYPAAYPDVIAVGASNASSSRASFSSYGPALDVVAPGSAIPRSTSWSQAGPTSTYSTNLSGTSYSSPIVASLASLIKSVRPSTSAMDIAAIINGTAQKTASMNGRFVTDAFGHGIIDAETALTIATTLNSTNTNPRVLQTGNSKKEHVVGPNLTNTSTGCEGADGDPCTAYFTNTNTGYSYYLPYKIMTGTGTGWSWHSATLPNGEWEVRARIGDNYTTTPYVLIRKG